MKKLILAAGILVSFTLGAQPSMYYWWVNGKTGEKICETAAPNKDWKKLNETVYQDFECKVPL